jgi:hypothetical protein
MLSALGAAFRDEAEEPVGAGGGHLHEIHTIDHRVARPQWRRDRGRLRQLGFLTCLELLGGEEFAADQQPPTPHPTGVCGLGNNEATAQSNSRGPFDPSPQLSRFHACSGAPAKVIGPTRPGRHADEGASGRHGNRLAAGHDDDVADASLLAPDAKLVLLPVGLVRGHPRCEDTGVERVRALPAPTPPWWRTRCRPDLRCSAAVPVGGPGLRRVELAVDQRAAFAGGVGEEHPSWQFSTRPAVPEYWRWTHLPRLLTDIDHRGQLGCPSSEAEAGREAADAQFSEVR